MRLARKGETVALAARPVQIDALRLARTDADNLLTADITCGSGTYIRSLARDIGEQLGCGAHLTQLRRLRIGIFDIADAIDSEQAQNLSQQDLIAKLLPMDRALANAPVFTLDGDQTTRVRNGQRLRLDAGSVLAAIPAANTDSATLVRVYDPNGLFIAVGEIAESVLKPLKVLA